MSIACACGCPSVTTAAIVIDGVCWQLMGRTALSSRNVAELSAGPWNNKDNFDTWVALNGNLVLLAVPKQLVQSYRLIGKTLNPKRQCPPIKTSV